MNPIKSLFVYYTIQRENTTSYLMIDIIKLQHLLCFNGAIICMLLDILIKAKWKI